MFLVYDDRFGIWVDSFILLSKFFLILSHSSQALKLCADMRESSRAAWCGRWHDAGGERNGRNKKAMVAVRPTHPGIARRLSGNGRMAAR